MHKALSRTLWGVVFVGGLTVLGAGAANAADTSGEDGIASGNQIGILSELPVTVGGNAISILGDSETTGSASQSAPSSEAPSSETSGAAATTSGHDSILGGNQVMPDATLPILIGGNSVSVVGDSTAGGEPASAGAAGDSDAPATTTGADGVASGNQVAPDIGAPVVVSGNDIAVIRDDGLLDGIVGDGVADGLLVVDPFSGEGMLPVPVVSQSPVGSSTGDTVLAEPVVDGPLITGVELAVLSPAETAVVDDGTVAENGTSSGLNPLMATAALGPAVMLAATGASALPLIGGIALMLATGLALVTSGRLTHAVN